MKNLQARVLKEVSKIPRGKVISYKTLAKKVKTHPRVVARALSRNDQLLKIPCHRVVHESRDVGGYKLGKEMKLMLLQEEGIKINYNKILPAFLI